LRGELIAEQLFFAAPPVGFSVAFFFVS